MALTDHEPAANVQPIRVDSIVVTARLRALREELVDDLQASIQQVGLLNPITIRRPHGGAVPHLVSGAHRLAAARRIGWQTIPCCTIDSDDDGAALVEIDENLARVELSPAERAMHVAKRKEIYERQHPETKHGAVGRGGKRDPNVRPFSFDTAAKTGRSRSAVAVDATRAKHIPQIGECIGTSLDQGDELDALAKLTPEQQAPIIEQAANGSKTSAKPAAKRYARSARIDAMAIATERASTVLGTKLYNVIYADPPWRFEPYSRISGMDRSRVHSAIAPPCRARPRRRRWCARSSNAGRDARWHIASASSATWRRSPRAAFVPRLRCPGTRSACRGWSPTGSENLRAHAPHRTPGRWKHLVHAGSFAHQRCSTPSSSARARSSSTRSRASDRNAWTSMVRASVCGMPRVVR